ncbi:MAG: SMC-Scp complex subunit ScpB [Gemmatales bacterium]|nr:SMC-Scp complex subunit ScpB [Gemmatales bacterium]MDW7995246.1 SMC-Scp complex subunit ScpB [Gemmatales bacterium]
MSSICDQPRSENPHEPSGQYALHAADSNGLTSPALVGVLMPAMTTPEAQSAAKNRAQGAEAYSASSDESPPPTLERILEAIFFVEGRAVSAQRAAEIIPDLSEEQFEQIVHQLQRRYREQGRPYGFVRHQEGYLLTLRPQYRLVVERLYGEAKEASLSLAAIEVLAIIAYKQPVSRSTIEALRGRDSISAIRQLLRRGLIAVHKEGTGGSASSSAQEALSTPNVVSPQPQADANPSGSAAGAGQRSAQLSEVITSAPRRTPRETLYVTTPRFLALFGLRDLNDLPRTDELEIL